MSSLNTTAYTPDATLSLYAPDELRQGARDIAQCVDVILSTQPGSDPLRVEFGTRYLDHIDTPVNVAAPRMVQEIIKALGRWEKRITVTAVTWVIVEHQIKYEVKWSSKYGDGFNILTL